MIKKIILVNKLLYHDDSIEIKIINGKDNELYENSINTVVEILKNKVVYYRNY